MTIVPGPLMPALGSIALLLALSASADGVASAAAVDDPTSGAPAATTPAAPNAPQGLVVVLRPVGPDELTEAAFTRIAGELSAARYRVLILPLENRTDPARQVERVAADQEPVAAVALARVNSAAGEAVAIWTCDRRTRRTTILRIQTTLPHPENQAAVLAVEAIELIRASIGGLETALSVPGPTPDLSGNSSAEGGFLAGGAGDGPRLSLGAGAAATWDLGLGGPTWSAVLWGGFRLTRQFTIHARLAELGSALHVTTPSGDAQVHRDVGAVGLAWTFLETEALDAFLTAGIGVTQVRAVGAAPTPAQVHAVTAWPLSATGGAGVRVHLATAVSIVAIVEASALARRLTLRFGEQESAPLSRPGIFTHAGLETTF